jgi:hypothetical protein
LPNHKKVIAFPVSRWRFYDYADDIEEWYRRLSEEGRDILNGLLKINSKAAEPRGWQSCKMMQPPCKDEGIWEWTFLADNTQQRLLGIFGEGRKAALFLVGCSHKQKIYKPRDCLEIAIKRARDVRAQKGRIFRERTVKENL